MGDMQFNGTPEEWDALVKKNKQKTMTAVDWFKQQLSTCSLNEIDDNINEWFKVAKQKEQDQRARDYNEGYEEGYTDGRR